MADAKLSALTAATTAANSDVSYGVQSATSRKFAFSLIVSAGLVQPNASGTDAVGGNLTVQPQAGTGTGAGGALIFKTAPAGGSSNSTANAGIERWRVTPDGTLAGQSPAGVYFPTVLSFANAGYATNLTIIAGSNTQFRAAGSVLVVSQESGALNALVVESDYTTTGQRMMVDCYDAASRGIVVKAAASQTANLQEWRDSSANPLARVTPAGWLQNTPGRLRVVSDVTNATATMAAVTGLSVTVKSGRKYGFILRLFCADSVAADGVKVDFNGGTATLTSFRAHGTVFDTALQLSTQTTDKDTDFSVSILTGASMVEVAGDFVPSADGTFVVRGAQASHTTGTATFYAGSYLWVEDSP